MRGDATLPCAGGGECPPTSPKEEEKGGGGVFSLIEEREGKEGSIASREGKMFLYLFERRKRRVYYFTSLLGNGGGRGGKKRLTTTVGKRGTWYSSFPEGSGEKNATPAYRGEGGGRIKHYFRTKVDHIFPSARKKKQGKEENSFASVDEKRG